MSSPAQTPASLDEFLAYARVTMAALYPGRNLESVVLVFGENCQMNLFVPPPTAKETPTGHSPDFRSVTWYGKRYSFTALQAAVVAVLWKAWEEDNPEVGQALLLEEAGSESGKLLDLFRGHPAVEDGFIARSGRAVWRLWEPD